MHAARCRGSRRPGARRAHHLDPERRAEGHPQPMTTRKANSTVRLMAEEGQTHPRLDRTDSSPVRRIMMRRLAPLLTLATFGILAIGSAFADEPTTGRFRPRPPQPPPIVERWRPPVQAQPTVE